MVALTRIVAIRLNSSNRASHPALADPAAQRPIADVRALEGDCLDYSDFTIE